MVNNVVVVVRYSTCMGTISDGLREDSTDIRLQSRIYFSGIWFNAVSTEIRLDSRRFFLSESGK